MGKANTAKFLDLQHFLNFFFTELSTVLVKRIRSQNQEYLNQYEESMGRGFYISSIPYTEESLIADRKPTTSTFNPLQRISDNLKKRLSISEKQAGLHIKKLWIVVVSEFGFGKTSLLLRLAHKLNQLGLEALYAPIALIPPAGFDAETKFIRSLLGIILQEENIDVNEQQVWDVSLRYILQSMPQFILLLDGLDEHRQAYSHEGLRLMMNCLRELTRHVILSVRREFWNERSGSIEAAFGSNITNRRIIVLDEWDDDTISSYLQKIQRIYKNNIPLEQLASLVRDRNYQEFYGDIPKRPLFLDMIVQDVIAGKLKKRNIAELYENYLLQKMRRDEMTPFSSTAFPRRLYTSDSLDLHDLQSRLLSMLGDIATKTIIRNDEGHFQLLEKFPEGWIKDAARSASLQADSILPYLLRTILVPIGKRTRQHPEIEIRFGHKSFQEYFIARRLASDLLTGKSSAGIPKSWRTQYPEGILAFLNSILTA